MSRVRAELDAEAERGDQALESEIDAMRQRFDRDRAAAISTIERAGDEALERLRRISDARVAELADLVVHRVTAGSDSGDTPTATAHAGPQREAEATS